MTLTNSTVSGNDTQAGAGISNSGTAFIEGCTFANNISSGDGGAIVATAAGTSIVNSTFNANTAGIAGGAVFAGDGCSLAVTNSTIVGNVGGTGGGIGISSSAVDATIYNTIVDENLNGNTSSSSNISGALDANLNLGQSPSSNNLIGAGGAGGLTNGSNGNQVGVTSPGLGSLANNGGPTETIALTSGSPAIDAGSTALALDAAGHPLITDQRGVGFPRETAGEVDIGAFQLQSNSAQSIYVDKSATGNNNGLDWEDAFTSLDSALQVVSSNPDGLPVIAIDIAAGTYVPGGASFNVPDFGGDLIVQGGFAPGGSATPDPSQNVTTLSGGSGVSNVLLDDAPSLSLNGLTISGGNAAGASFPQNEGGGVKVVVGSGTLTVMRCNFTNNIAAADGGAIYVASAATALSVSDSTFSGNRATGNSAAGGAIYTLADSSTFTSCTFMQNNTAFGGAIDAQSAVSGGLSVLTLAGDTFTSNTASA